MKAQTAILWALGLTATYFIYKQIKFNVSQPKQTGTKATTQTTDNSGLKDFE